MNSRLTSILILFLSLQLVLQKAQARPDYVSPAYFTQHPTTGASRAPVATDLIVLIPNNTTIELGAQFNTGTGAYINDTIANSLSPAQTESCIRVANTSGQTLAVSRKTKDEWESVVTTTHPGVTASLTCCSKIITYTAAASLTVPARCTRMIVYAWGGGGGYVSGGDAATAGGFAYSRTDSPSLPTSPITITIGGGAGDANTEAGSGDDVGGIGGTNGDGSPGASSAPNISTVPVVGELGVNDTNDGGDAQYSGGGGASGAGVLRGSGGAGGGPTKVTLNGIGHVIAGGGGGASGNDGLSGSGGRGGQGLSEALGTVTRFTGTLETFNGTTLSGTNAAGADPVTAVNVIRTLSDRNGAATFPNGVCAGSAHGSTNVNCGRAGTATAAGNRAVDGLVVITFDRD